jgi:hypothetical protein
LLEQNLVGDGVERRRDSRTDPNADNPELIPKDQHQSHGNAQGEVCEASDECSFRLLTGGSDYRGSDALGCIKDYKDVESNPSLADLCLDFWILGVKADYLVFKDEQNSILEQSRKH